MISFLDGEVAEKAANRVVLVVHGVGYDVVVPTSVLADLPPVGRSARVHTRMVVRDDGITLYGFATHEQRALFDLLTGVTGVGPKVAIAFLSTLATDALRRAIVDGDVGALSATPGVGKKLAQRVVVDLRDRLGGDGLAIDATGPLVDVRDALVSLGLTPQEAVDALTGIEVDGREVEDLLREALQRVGR
ncbi:MAG TPA: Holliday junction branch migration protein RuvA [Actinomycetota bacterium]|nr:Holliday junction branch migration protein RuvA [Actinomycetota bacterium]